MTIFKWITKKEMRGGSRRNKQEKSGQWGTPFFQKTFWKEENNCVKYAKSSSYMMLEIKKICKMLVKDVKVSKYMVSVK